MQVQILPVVATHFITLTGIITATAVENLERRNNREQLFPEERKARAEAYLTELRNAPAQRMKEVLRLTPFQFTLLLEILENDADYPLRALPSASPAVQLAIFLYFVGGGARYRTIGEIFTCGPTLISRSVHRVLKTLCSLYEKTVDLPDNEVPPSIRDNPKFYPFFNGCVGAIDGTLIPISIRGLTKDELAPWRSRKGMICQNVLAAVDFDMNFRYVLSGWEGSAHDGQVLTSAREKGFKAPPGCYYLADAGYTANGDLLLVPYQKTRYHLREWGIANQRPATEQELFNLRHSQLRNVVERVFGVFKQRFPILEAPRKGLSIKTQANLIYALAYLHNFLNSSGSDPFAEMATLPNGEPSDEIPMISRVDQERVERRDRIAKEAWIHYQGYLELRGALE